MDLADVYQIAVRAIRHGYDAALERDMGTPPVQPTLWNDAASTGPRVPRGRAKLDVDPDEQEEDIVRELVVTGSSLGYSGADILHAVQKLVPRLGERTACVRIMDRMLARQPIFGAGPNRSNSAILKSS